MKENIIKKVFKEPQTILSLAYVLAIGIGMLFNYQKYIHFRINIFNYSDVFDFLIAPFADIKILLFSFTSIAILSLLIFGDIYWKQNYPDSYSRANFGLDKKKWFNSTRYMTFVLGFLVYLSIAANIYGEYALKIIQHKEPISIEFIDNETTTGKLIGKTKDTIFLLNAEKVEAIPITSIVKSIEIK